MVQSVTILYSSGKMIIKKKIDHNFIKFLNNFKHLPSYLNDLQKHIFINYFKLYKFNIPDASLAN